MLLRMRLLINQSTKFLIGKKSAQNPRFGIVAWPVRTNWVIDGLQEELFRPNAALGSQLGVVDLAADGSFIANNGVISSKLHVDYGLYNTQVV